MKSFHKCFIFIICFAILCLPIMISTGFASNLNLLSRSNGEGLLNQSGVGLCVCNNNNQIGSLENVPNDATKSSTNLTEFVQTYYNVYFQNTENVYYLKLYVGSTVFKTVTCTYDQRIDLTDSEYKIVKQDSRYIYEFLGWWNNPNFSGNALTYVNLTEDISLYAQFNVKEIYSLNKQTTLIILGSLIGLIFIVLIFASVKALTLREDGWKFSRKKVSEIKTEHEEIKKERQEVEEPIKELKGKNKVDDLNEVKNKTEITKNVTNEVDLNERK